jgi:phosphoribosylformimino-5-aminoimidazole carboxamide ribotide isomerase
MKFRPCIDLHEGKVKQIVGSSLTDIDPDALVVNYVSDRTSAWYARCYRADGFDGGHVIMLGPGNETAAREALSSWPGGLQIGGGINDRNAVDWLESGAEKVIVTSFVFFDGQAHRQRLTSMERAVGRERLVLDLSCRKQDDRYWIVTDRWQRRSNVAIDRDSLDYFSQFCSEFLIHAVDVEGKRSGIETQLVSQLGEWGKLPVTYAGGVNSWADIAAIEHLGHSNIDFTIGSALDIFGGSGFRYQDLVNRFSPTR